MTARITIVDLARQLGVSRQTISNVLNAPHKVREDTRVRIAAAIEQSGYVPNSAARQLRNHRSMHVGMRLPPANDGINGAVLNEFLHGLTEAANAHGYRLTLFCADSDEQELSRYDELLRVADLDGFVLTATQYADTRSAWLTAEEVPFVAFGRPWGHDSSRAESSHSWVDVDGRFGVRMATNHLLEQGHRRVGFIGWPRGQGVGDDRRSGWADAMASRFPRDEWASLSCSGEDSAAAGSSAAAFLLDEEVSAIVCASDTLALGASSYLRQSRQPGMASAVIGFDNSPVAAAVGLSSVSQPVREASTEVMRLMLRQLNTTAPEPQHVLLRPALELRDIQPFNH